MVLKIVCCFIVLSFTERFMRKSFEVVISLLLILRESLGNDIMFFVLFLNGGEFCKLWSMGVVQL
jgi:hypothetical protein